MTETVRNMPLGQVLQFQRGFDITKAEQTIGSVPIVSSSGVSSYHNKAKVKAPGLVIGRKGTLGTVHFLSKDFWPHDTTLWVKDFKGNEPRFLFYFLKTLHLEVFDTGSSNPTLNRNHLHKIKVKVPQLSSQKKIAYILSAYDDLIENNKRRITILEKMAEEIYREWFVRMRFPDTDGKRNKDQIPEGWRFIEIGDLIKRIPVGKRYEQKTASPSGKTPILDQGQSGIIGYHDNEPGIVASFSEPVIVFANHTCYQRLIFHPFSTIQNVLPFVPSEENRSDIFWLYYATVGKVELSEYKGHWPAFAATKIAYPGFGLTEQFGLVVRPLVAQAENLKKQIQVLVQSRDLLLPRLISGKLSVEDLELPSNEMLAELGSALPQQELAHA